MVESIFRHIKYYWFKRNSGNTKKKLQFFSSVFYFVEMANQVVQVVLRCETANETEHLGNKTMPNERKSNSCLAFMITYAMYIIQYFDLWLTILTYYIHCRLNIEIYHSIYRVHLPSENCWKKNIMQTTIWNWGDCFISVPFDQINCELWLIHVICDITQSKCSSAHGFFRMFTLPSLFILNQVTFNWQV